MTDTLRRVGPWTPEEDGLLRSMAAAGESVAAIMKLLKRTEPAIRNRARDQICPCPTGAKAEGEEMSAADKWVAGVGAATWAPFLS